MMMFQILCSFAVIAAVFCAPMGSLEKSLKAETLGEKHVAKDQNEPIKEKGSYHDNKESQYDDIMENDYNFDDDDIDGEQQPAIAIQENDDDSVFEMTSEYYNDEEDDEDNGNDNNDNNDLSFDIVDKDALSKMSVKAKSFVVDDEQHQAIVENNKSDADNDDDAFSVFDMTTDHYDDEPIRYDESESESEENKRKQKIMAMEEDDDDVYDLTHDEDDDDDDVITGEYDDEGDDYYDGNDNGNEDDKESFNNPRSTKNVENKIEKKDSDTSNMKESAMKTEEKKRSESDTEKLIDDVSNINYEDKEKVGDKENGESDTFTWEK